MADPRQLDLLKGPRQKGVKPPPAPEFAIHCMVADTLRRWASDGWFWTHTASGEKRDKSTGARLKRMGLKPGLFDFLLIDPHGLHYWLELKRKGEKLSDEQQAFQAILLKATVDHAMADSYYEAVRVLKYWGAVKGVVHVT